MKLKNIFINYDFIYLHTLIFILGTVRIKENQTSVVEGLSQTTSCDQECSEKVSLMIHSISL